MQLQALLKSNTGPPIDAAWLPASGDSAFAMAMLLPMCIQHSANGLLHACLGLLCFDALKEYQMSTNSM